MRTNLTIVAGDFVATGGMDRANLALAEGAVARKLDVCLVTYRATAALSRRPGVRVLQVKKPLRSYTLGAPLLGAAGLFEGVKSSATGGTVVVNGGSCPYPGVNWVHYLHAAYEPSTDGASWQRARTAASHRVSLATERVALRAARVVVANSERTRRDIIDRIGVDARRVHTVYYGIDPVAFRPPTPEERAAARAALGWLDDRPRVAFIGALGDRRKGFDTLFHAWRALAKTSSWDPKLIVIGAGVAMNGWRRRAAAEGLTSSVEFLGFRDDVPRLLAASDLLVSATRYEAYGLGVQEALCCGLPALVSARAGVAERYPLDLQSLLLDDPEDADALAEKLSAWRGATRELGAKMLAFSSALRERSWNDMATDILDLCGQA